MNLSEFELIRKITKQIPVSLQESARLRDDTGVLKSLSALFPLMTSDTIVENVDFQIDKAGPEQIGKKALAINLSDIAAMGGTPIYFTIALGIPSYLKADWIRRFYNGILFWAKRYRVVCAGGDVSKAPCFFSNITVLGHRAKRPIMRNRACAGDWIGVTGRLGGSILKHHLLFKPRLEEGCFLADKSVTSMIDVSDGLLQDMEHILLQSQVGCILRLEDIPVSEAARCLHQGNDSKCLKAALTDGEDFELLFTAPPEIGGRISRSWNKKFPKVRLSWIGRITRSKKKQILSEDGKLLSWEHFKKKGFQHFT